MMSIKIYSHLWKGGKKTLHEFSVNSVYVTLHAEDVQGPTENVSFIPIRYSTVGQFNVILDSFQ